MNNLYRIIVDFLRSGPVGYGLGFFEGIDGIVRASLEVRKVARRKFARYGTVPPQFFQGLIELRILPVGNVPSGGVSLTRTRFILEQAGFRERLSPSERRCCGLSRADGSQQHIWHKIMSGG